MVMRKGGRKMRKGGKRPARRQFMGKRANIRSKRNVVEFAGAKQTVRLIDDAMGLVYTLDDINLSQFDRLSNIARNYQYYRITRVEMKFLPYSDTYTAGAAITVPYFHYLINKSDNIDVGTFNQLRDAGAKPIRFDDKTVTISWRPTVPTGIAANQPLVGPPTGTIFGQYRQCPWLATNQNVAAGTGTWTPSTVPHKGLLYGVHQDQNGGVQQFYGTQITVYAQFKKPLTFEQNAVLATKKRVELVDDTVNT